MSLAAVVFVLAAVFGLLFTRLGRSAADRVGTERGQPFVGQSLIVSYTGWPIGGPASASKEEIIYAEVNLADARRKRNWNEYNQVLRDRRDDFYGKMLGSNVPPGWH